MKEDVIQKTTELPDPYVDGDPEYLDSRPLLSGLNLASVVEQLNKFKSTAERNDPNISLLSTINRSLDVDVKQENQNIKTMFNGLPLAEAYPYLKQLKSKQSVVTVSQYLEDWVVDNYPDPNTAEGRTRTGYEGYIRDYIKPQIGSIPLTELTPHQTHHFINWLKKEARSPKTKGPLSKTTQAHVCACLCKALNDAVRDELIPRNPLTVKISLPKSSNIPAPFSKKELNTLLEAKNIPDYSLIATAALTGTRPGELLACCWKDYDFYCGILAIRHRLESHSHCIKDTKTYQERLVPLLEMNQVALLDHYKNSKFNKPDDFIWPNKSGGPLNESVVSSRFTKSLQKLGLRKIRLYDLRHGHITELLNDGVPQANTGKSRACQCHHD